ncbi:MAG: TVP38/TMEM64 family protein [Nitrospinae bacterium]|nr:TVP38/TMEM64 family protein [Nitrospinota bacterium]
MDKNRLTLIKLLVFVLILVTFTSFAWYYANGAHITSGEFVRMVDGYRDVAPFIFVFAYGALLAFGFPPTPLTIIGALLFGRVFGSVLNALGLILGAAGAFWASRFFMGDFFAPHLEKRKWMGDFNEGVKKNGFYYVLFIRLVPVIPYGAVNYAAGLTKISFGPFIAATAIGVTPHVFILTNTVVEVGESATSGFRVTTGLVLSFALMAFAVLVPVLVQRYLKNRPR